MILLCWEKFRSGMEPRGVRHLGCGLDLRMTRRCLERIVIVAAMLFTIVATVGTECAALSVMFDGDSISSGGINGNKFNNRHYSLGQSHAYLAAAKLHRYVPKTSLNFMNFAAVGNTLQEMCDRLNRTVPIHQPDVVSLLIGINDVWPTIGTGTDPEFSATFEKRLNDCIQNVFVASSSSELSIMLGLPSVFNVSRLGPWNEWQEKLAQVHTATKSVAAKHHCVVVDYPSKFLYEVEQQATVQQTSDANTPRTKLIEQVWSSWSGDGVHPTPVGHHIMAEVWLNSFLGSVLPRYSQSRSEEKLETVISALPENYVFNVSASPVRTPPYHVRPNDSAHTPGKASETVYPSASIVFEGDSITNGFRDVSRTYDYLYAIGQGFPFILTGYILSKYPTKIDQYAINNYGVNGDTVAHVEARWTRTMQRKPWITHLLVGINDILVAMMTQHRIIHPSTKQFETRTTFNATALEQSYERLLMTATKENPDGIVIIGIPFAYPGSMTIGMFKREDTTKDGTEVETTNGSNINANEHWAKWQEHLSSVKRILVRLGTKYSYPVIDYPAVFEAAIVNSNSDSSLWMVDGIHPTPACHHVMAEEILKTINSIYTKQTGRSLL
jgi:lysophospholipase L1-like esterase